MLMRLTPGLLLAVALLAPALRVSALESQASCLSAYKADYGANWRLPRESWDRQCAAGRESGEIIRHHQAAETQSCTRKFVAAAPKGGLNEFDVRAYCARGSAGEAILSSRTGIPLETPASPPAAAAAPRETNAWTRIYALTRVIGDSRSSRIGPDGKTSRFTTELDSGGFLIVLPRYPGVEARPHSEEVCEFNSMHCDSCEDVQGFGPDRFYLNFRDIGCRGDLTTIRWIPSQDEKDEVARASLDEGKFKRIGERQEAALRQYFRHRIVK